jgi:hypothetical protein
MAWKKGESGNLKGKPKGATHRATRLAITLFEGDAEEIVAAVINKAKDGDMVAARIVIERLLPPAKERPIQIALPDTSTTEGIGAAQDTILAAVSRGDLLPGEGDALMSMIDARRKAIETHNFEQRIAALEQKK